MRRLANGNLSLLHAFKKGALHFRRGAVNFVGKEDLRENRPLFDAKASRPLIDKPPNQIRWEHIRHKLHPLELQPRQVSQGRCHECLCYTGDALQ